MFPNSDKIIARSTRTYAHHDTRIYARGQLLIAPAGFDRAREITAALKAVEVAAP